MTFTVTAPGAVTTRPSTSTAAPGITEDILADQEPGLTTQQTQATVTGKTTPGATVDISVGQPGTSGNTTVIVQAVVGPDGTFHAVVPTPPGQSILTVSVTAGAHATGWAQQTVTGTRTISRQGRQRVFAEPCPVQLPRADARTPSLVTAGQLMSRMLCSLKSGACRATVP